MKYKKIKNKLKKQKYDTSDCGLAYDLWLQSNNLKEYCNSFEEVE